EPGIRQHGAARAGETEAEPAVGKYVEVDLLALGEREAVAIGLARHGECTVDARAERERGVVVDDRQHVELIRGRAAEISPALERERVGSGDTERLYVDVGPEPIDRDLVAVRIEQPPGAVAVADRLHAEVE